MTGGDSGAALVISAAALRRALLLLIALAVIGGLFYLGRGVLTRAPTAAEQIDRNAYQVVFLTTGQAFYGRLSIPDADTYLLNDVFYPVTNDTGLRLVKRGTEVFGPRDPMVVSGRQVLYFENLRDDSDIVVAIRAIKSGQGGTAPAVGSPPPATAAPVGTGTARPSASR